MAKVSDIMVDYFDRKKLWISATLVLFAKVTLKRFVN
jgi:hypothetical protein